MRNLNEAKNLALKAEFMLQDRGRYEAPRRNYGGEVSRASVEKGVTNREPQMIYDKFREEKVVGKQKLTEVKESPKLANPYARPAPIKCFKCNQTGHRSSDCPFRKVVHLAEREEQCDDGVCCELDGYGEEDDAYEEEDDQGRNYVVRKLMLTPKQEENNQCHQLFRTRCNISGKLFELIIDSDSCENIISKEAVRLLKLPVEKHLNPYTIGWIKATEKIEVKKRCKVPFSIGKYQDEVYCDVVDMDACQLLFGRSWQYDLDTQHARKENVYR